MRPRVSFENRWGWRSTKSGEWYWFPGDTVPLLGLDMVVDPGPGFILWLLGFGFGFCLELKEEGR